MNHKLKYSIVLMIGSLSLSGCAGYDRILFVTKTNIGLDVDNKPPTAEITIARRELAITPTYQDTIGRENTLPLLASFGLMGNFLSPHITSQFAGGEAAIIIARGSDTNDNPGADSSAICLSKEPDMRPPWKKIWHYFVGRGEENTRAFYFATDTSFGLKVGWDGTGGLYPDNLKLGYNRKEIAFPPIFVKAVEKCEDKTAPSDGEKWEVTVPSFFASLNNSSALTTRSESGVTHVQFFATGKAATEFVKRPDVNKEIYKKLVPPDVLSENDGPQNKSRMPSK